MDSGFELSFAKQFWKMFGKVPEFGSTENFENTNQTLKEQNYCETSFFKDNTLFLQLTDCVTR